MPRLDIITFCVDLFKLMDSIEMPGDFPPEGETVDDYAGGNVDDAFEYGQTWGEKWGRAELKCEIQALIDKNTLQGEEEICTQDQVG